MPRQYPPDPLEFARLLNTNRRQRRHKPLPTLARLLRDRFQTRVREHPRRFILCS